MGLKFREAWARRRANWWSCISQMKMAIKALLNWIRWTPKASPSVGLLAERPLWTRSGRRWWYRQKARTSTKGTALTWSQSRIRYSSTTNSSRMSWPRTDHKDRTSNPWARRRTWPSIKTSSQLIWTQLCRSMQRGRHRIMQVPRSTLTKWVWTHNQSSVEAGTNLPYRWLITILIGRNWMGRFWTTNLFRASLRRCLPARTPASSEADWEMARTIHCPFPWIKAAVKHSRCRQFQKVIRRRCRDSWK